MKAVSFSSNVKEELSKISNLTDRECVEAELLGYLISNNTKILREVIKYSTESEYNINRFGKLLSNTNTDYKIKLSGKVYSIIFPEVKLTSIEYQSDGLIAKQEAKNIKEDRVLKSIIRGAFLGGGSINDPSNKYHLEIILSTKNSAEWLIEILAKFNIIAKIFIRERGYSIYIKEGEQISNMLALIGANTSVLKFEQVRVIRDTKNNVNRMVNCETYNLEKTVTAGVTQINAINKIKKAGKFEQLPRNLKVVAELRLQNPDVSLAQLGLLLKNPLGKSGVNHRLRQICQIASELEE